MNITSTQARANQIATHPKRRRVRPLPGVVVEQWNRCGRPTCACASGALHGPYYRRRWWEGGRYRSEYISRRRVPYVRRQCAAWRAQRIKDRTDRTAAMDRWRQVRALLREVEREYLAR
jgi:hypothetical protein